VATTVPDPPVAARRTCTEGVLLAVALAANTVFSHVLGEGIAAPPGGHGVITAVCVPSFPWLLELDPVRVM
jgi:hypothetical protein